VVSAPAAVSTTDQCVVTNTDRGCGSGPVEVIPDESACEEALTHLSVARLIECASHRVALATCAMETVGGQGFYRGFELERLFRDVPGAKYHPLPEAEQLAGVSTAQAAG
jgi:alkylation response protein AidB-like acyl-CoA dehydrogenase